jgi:hypothetical protein
MHRPGFSLCHYVDGFAASAVGPVPRVRTRPDLIDRLGTLMVRVGIRRMAHLVVPGLYAVGSPDRSSPVLATANYKLSFDALRFSLAGQDAWVLVLDTRGVNVWCAAGKGTLSTDELVRRVQATRLAEVTERREIVLPQLAATGVSAFKARRACGFAVLWGPVRASDLPAFLATGQKAAAPMRRVTFTLAERLVLVPVEISLALRPLAGALLAAFALAGARAGIGPGPFSLAAAGEGGTWLGLALLAGTLMGCLGLPLLLPWLPGRMFSLKAGLLGLVGGGLVAALVPAAGLERLGLVLVAAATASWLGMNFTGCTPYTSPSGVEWEMRRAMPVQAAALLAGAVAFVLGPFF